MKPSKKEFLQHRNPVFAKSHAQDMTNPFWVWCVKTEDSAYGNNEAFGGPSPFEAGPCWSFQRFGQTKTELPDGRVVCIGGEHEDSYDPDFYIYNDVTVVSPDGKATIFGYPENDFPPTDNHSATLVADKIILIGSLGYYDKRREGETQVMLLDTSDWTITRQHTTNPPGWISGHQAFYDEEKDTIIISGGQRWTEDHGLIDDFSTWALDLKTWEWCCLEKPNWTQFFFTRKDEAMNNLWSLRHHIEMDEMGMTNTNLLDYIDQDIDDDIKAEISESMEDMQKEEAELIKNTNLNLIPTLYRTSVPHKVIDPPEYDYENDELPEGYDHHLIEINGVTIRFIEDSYHVTMRVEGNLPKDMLKYIADEVCDKLGDLEKTDYLYQEIPS